MSVVSKFSREGEVLVAKTMKGHEGRRRVGIEYVCACGWTTCIFYGKGATSQAAVEFKWHKRQLLCEAGVLG